MRLVVISHFWRGAIFWLRSFQVDEVEEKRPEKR